MQYIFLMTFLATIIIAQTITPRVIRGHDGYRSRGHSGGSMQESMGLSTIDASSEISIQVTSISLTEASSHATSNRPQQRRRNYSELKFLKDNRVKITKDISQGSGEHLFTLLDMMKLKRDSNNLSKIQSNFEKLLVLDNKEFLFKLKKISNS